jgi:predicted GNAT family N-acyltransferase
MPKIRRATINDLKVLSDLSIQTFIETFGANYSKEDLFVENHRAQKFYQKYGFVYARDTIYHVGNTRDHELIYLKK